MATEPVESFLRTLQELEESGDITPLLELFTEDAELVKPAAPGIESGRDGARHFWESYLRAFDHIRSTFTRVIESDGLAVLEWTSEGTRMGAEPIRYDGVSILEITEGRVKRFRTYYDSAALLQRRV